MASELLSEVGEYHRQSSLTRMPVKVTMSRFRLVTTLLLGGLAAAPATAEASVFHVDPLTGQITAASGTLSFTFISRHAGYAHLFGLYTTTRLLVSPIFTAPDPHLPGAAVNLNVTAGTPFLFGLGVWQSGNTWFSDGTNSQAIAGQDLKFRYTAVDQFTMRLEMEDLRNVPGTTTCYSGTKYWHVWYGWQYSGSETCDYNDMVVEVTNMPEYDLQTTVTPEPATLVLMASGLGLVGGMAVVRRRRTRSS